MGPNKAATQRRNGPAGVRRAAGPRVLLEVEAQSEPAARAVDVDEFAQLGTARWVVHVAVQVGPVHEGFAEQPRLRRDGDLQPAEELPTPAVVRGVEVLARREVLG